MHRVPLSPLVALLLALPVVGHADEGDAAATAIVKEAKRVDGAHSGLARALSFHPDLPRLASGGSDRALRLWEPLAEKPAAELVLPRSG
jgi:WD40 repeat protein